MNIQYIHPAGRLVMFMQRIYDKGLTTTSGPSVWTAPTWRRT